MPNRKGHLNELNICNKIRMYEICFLFVIFGDAFFANTENSACCRSLVYPPANNIKQDPPNHCIKTNAETNGKSVAESVCQT